MGIVKFGDVVERINIKVDQSNPQLNYMEHGRRIIIPIKYYVGGEHIEGSEFMVHKKALIQGSTIGYQFQFGFRKGDILFMTKNPHLRKASMVDFDGLCSIATFVIASKSNNLLQNYLLLEMQSDRFWQYCEDNKSGGVNYFINWGTLSNYEFDLPPIEKQKELADKLWAAYRLKEGYKRLFAAIDEMVKSQFIEMFGNTSKEMLGKFIQVIRGVSYKPSDVKTADDPDTAVILRSNNINDANLNTDEVVYINKNRVSGDQYLRVNDIVVCASNGSKALVGKAAINKTLTNQYAHGAFCLLVRPNDNINPVYLNTFFQTSLYKKQIDELAAGSNILNIKQEYLTNMILPLPIIEEQNKFAIIAEQADKSKFELKQCIENIDKVIKSLING